MNGRPIVIDNTPSARQYLRIAQARDIGWKSGLGELIDNGFDAQASTIEFGWEHARTFYCRDNGIGCEDPARLVTVGRHAVVSPGSPRLGTYGAGAKDMFLWLWGTLHLKSTWADGAWTCDVNWEAINSWHDIGYFGAEPSGAKGLEVRIEKADHAQPNRLQLKELLDRLAFTYSPALRKGQRIICRPHNAEAVELKPIAEPPLAKSLVAEIHLGRKTAVVMAGIVDEASPNYHPGFSYAFQYRVIRPSSTLGCGPYGSARVWGWVELQDDPSWADDDPRKWRLTVNKDNFMEADALGEKIAEECADLLKEATEQPRYINIEEISQRAMRNINRVFRTEQKVKEKRTRRGLHGTHPPGDGTQKRKPKVTQPGGSDQKQRASGGIRVEIVDFNGEHPGIGVARLDDVVIRLNKEDKHIAKAVADGDDRRISDAAVTLLLSELSTGKLHHRIYGGLLRGRDNDGDYWFSRKLSQYWTAR